MNSSNRVIYFALLFFFVANIVFAKEVVLQNNNFQNDYSGKILSIQNNNVTILNYQNKTIETLTLSDNEIKNLKKGDILIIKSNNNSLHTPQCRCRNIRERIRKLAEKRRHLHNNFGNHHNWHGFKHKK